MTIVGLCGYARCGKDTAFQKIAEKLPGKFKRVAFADVLKEEVKQMLNIVGITVDFTDTEQKEFWRDFLVFWGRKRREINADYWVKKAFEKITDNTIITDVRYVNEVEQILGKGGIVIRIKRNGINADNSEEYNTIMEIDKIYLQLPIVNNNGTPEDMADKILKILGEENL